MSYFVWRMAQKDWIADFKRAVERYREECKREPVRCVVHPSELGQVMATANLVGLSAAIPVVSAESLTRGRVQPGELWFPIGEAS